MNAADPMMVLHQAFLALGYILWFSFNFALFVTVGLAALTFTSSYIDRASEWLFRRKSH